MSSKRYHLKQYRPIFGCEEELQETYFDTMEELYQIDFLQDFIQEKNFIGFSLEHFPHYQHDPDNLFEFTWLTNTYWLKLHRKNVEPLSVGYLIMPPGSLEIHSTELLTFSVKQSKKSWFQKLKIW